MKSKDSKVVISFEFKFGINLNTNICLGSGDTHTSLRISLQELPRR
jgi:hypothetical protein